MAHVLNMLNIGKATERAQLAAIYQRTGIPKTLHTWVMENSGRYMKRREQIRAMSAFSVDPDAEIFVVNKFSDTAYRIRYCLVLPERRNRVDQAIRGVFHSQAVNMELCDKISSIQTVRENFDLVLLNELPHNEAEAWAIVCYCINIVREGGNLLVMTRNEGELSRKQQELYLKYNMPYHLFLSTNLHALLKQNRIPYESFETPCPYSYVDKVDRKMLVTIMLGLPAASLSEEDLANCDEFLKSVHETVTVFDIPCGPVHSRSLDQVQRHIDAPADEWFPQGRYGPFVNVGMEHWLAVRREWVGEDDSSEKPASSAPRDPVAFRISDVIMSRSQIHFPKPIPLGQLTEQLAQYWKENPE